MTIDPALWIHRYHPSPAASRRLVCFPHVGGSASAYFWLSKSLAPAYEVLAIQYPGRQERRREPVALSLHALVDQVFEALRGQVAPPFAFFGHSMGALVAFEVARRSAAAGEPGPSLLVVSGRRAPSTGPEKRFDVDDENMLVAELRRMGGTAEQFIRDEEVRAMILPVARADYRALHAYVPQPDSVVDTPILALVGDNDPVTTLEEAKAWSAHSTSTCELRVFPGGHFYLESAKADVSDTLRTALR
ncbi:thioesterase II family protein [Sphaerisporangium dianthi]|uniref:Thioesterase II family protein n=1 Tax=Sphaerisporangium dianthi TaxID=1436120 RepID=A0ABV9CS98_9ACTN